MVIADVTHAQQVEAILASRDEPLAFLGVRKRREAVLIAEVERQAARIAALEAALVEERAARLWYRWVAEIGYGLSGEWGQDESYLLPENRPQQRFRLQARAELVAEGLLPQP